MLFSHSGWREYPRHYCRACKMPRKPELETCHECGYMQSWYLIDCIEAAQKHKLPELFGKPAEMSSDEFALRLGLLSIYLTSRTTEFLTRLQEFADWLTEQDRPEELAARARWSPRRAGAASREGLPEGERVPWSKAPINPLSWWNWEVRVHESWCRANNPIFSMHGYLKQQAKVGRQQHNGTWFLCWPPGWVKFTSPSTSLTSWYVTVEPNRSLAYSQPHEHRHHLGYTKFFHARKSE